MKWSVFHAAHVPLGQPPEEKAMGFPVLRLLSWVCYPLGNSRGKGCRLRRVQKPPECWLTNTTKIPYDFAGSAAFGWIDLTHGQKGCESFDDRFWLNWDKWSFLEINVISGHRLLSSLCVGDLSPLGQAQLSIRSREHLGHQCWPPSSLSEEWAT